jgi:hypothetical protein
LRDGDFAEEDAWPEGVAGRVAEDFAHDAVAVDRASHAGIRGANHWDVVFHATEEGVANMLE